MEIPAKEREVIKVAEELVQICGVSMGTRSAAYQQASQYIETGRVSGGLSLANTLYSHVDRLSSYLFSPTDARFSIEFENAYPKEVLLQAEMAGRLLTRAFGRKNFDLTFGEGVWQSLAYGASVVKLSGSTETTEINGKPFTHIKKASARIVPPWLMGVENEGRNGFDGQEAIMETVFLSEWDVKRRIATLPDSDKLWRRIKSHSDKTGGPTLPSAFVMVLSTAQLNISPQGSNPPSPGGIIQIAGAGDPNYSTTGPQVMADQYAMRELWVWDDSRSDWLMIQMIDPDILIAPRYKRENAFCTGCLPHTLIQPNVVPGYFWGRSEITDLTRLQGALSETMDDFQRLMGLQYDGRYSFEGFDGITDEMFDDFRNSGWIGGRAGSKVTDMTPKVPREALEYIKLCLDMSERVAGFDNVLSGQGEPGVRAGNHADLLMKTASPRLRDRSLIVERNYAAFGDNYLSYMEAKDGTEYYYDPKDPKASSFLLEQIPDDRQVQVDSHSSSPIYENDHNQLVSFGLKGGLIAGDDALDMLNYPNKDELKRKWIERQAAQQKLLQEHPELYSHMHGGGKK